MQYKCATQLQLMKHTIACFIIFLFMLCIKGNAQEEFVTPQSKPIAKFGFTQLTGGIIILQGQIDQIPDTLNFILDTGSGGISLDSSTVEEFKLPRQKSERTIRGIAGMKTVDFTYHHSLKLPGLKVDNLDFHINDYDLLSSAYGVKIDGIIGFSFLRKFIVKIDYDSLKIEVYNPGQLKYPKGGYLFRPSFNTLPFSPSIIRDERAVLSRFIFDTGAGLCFLLSRDFVDDSNFISKKHKMYPTQAEGLGGKKVMDITVFKELQFGPYHFRKVPGYIFSDEFNVTSYPILGGLIGNDLLRRFNVILNYPDQVIYLKPNTHFNDNFDYSYTGMGIYMVDGQVTVVDIIAGSPSERAGFKEGDIIYAIDKDVSRNIQSIKSALQVAGARVKVLVMRNKELITLDLHIKDMLRK